MTGSRLTPRSNSSTSTSPLPFRAGPLSEGAILLPRPRSTSDHLAPLAPPASLAAVSAPLTITRITSVPAPPILLRLIMALYLTFFVKYAKMKAVGIGWETDL